ncbi:hypothetical protein TBLA_0E00450 [Henningerozyma blattae CBS 6284]|uniref:Ubiquinone biosynthesis protein n=1 Tax=Henningerozyma blattae (strain ATCC 34711 / CBS 6284 / DSM 70876 / NBRC 10599 / NRRL Y-10934 / UCD 77-7) TaxID=1071380 RepID=I2H404_HENB6|nr:hypothetical protein TBLA_0E00450 [Tetrapisispora blattae CBS 6284]CCH61106.1 hypothetical protein TBLA_0E00450 [Tetrapisispora blattae CBS 6284]
MSFLASSKSVLKTNSRCFLLNPNSILLSKHIKNNGIRTYYSVSNDVKKSDHLEPLLYGKDSAQYRILEDAVQNSVPTFGFTERAIINSINKLGYNSSMISVLGSSNTHNILHSSPAVLELLKFNLVSKRLKLSEGIDPETKDLPSLEYLLLKRLQMDKAIQSRLNEMITKLSIPGTFLAETSIPELFRLSDDMIYFSNEKDHHDMAWYSKRLAVSTTYIASQIFMAQDTSVDCYKTLEFAQDKLNKVMNLGEYYNNTEEFLWFTLMTSVNIVKSQLARS